MGKTSITEVFLFCSLAPVSGVKKKIKKYLHILQMYDIITRLWHDSVEARGCCLQSEAGFPWSECQVRKLATSHCTN